MLYKLIPSVKEASLSPTKLQEKFKKEPLAISLTEFSAKDDGSYIPLLDSKLLLKNYMESSELGLNGDSNLPLFEVSINESKDDTIFITTSNTFIYILDAKDGDKVLIGFKDTIDKEDALNLLESNEILEYLNQYEVKRSDYFTLNKGTLFSVSKDVIYYMVIEDKTPKKISDFSKGEIKDLIKTDRYISHYKKLHTKSSYKLIYSNKSFEVLRLGVKEKFTIKTYDKSFFVSTLIKGRPSVMGEKINPLESFYLDKETDALVEGEGEFIIVRVPKYYAGLDVGGTSVKGLIIDDNGLKVAENKTIMDKEKDITDILTTAFKTLCDEANIPVSSFNKLGIGFPGNINSRTGEVVFSNNLGLHHYLLKEELEKVFDLEVIVDNDANCAALGEYKYTDKRRYHDMVLITLGTGFGSGVIIDSKLFKGGQGSVTELGHMKVKSDKVMCTCGQYGCIEALTSLSRIKMEVDKLKDDESTGLKDLIKDEESPLKIFQLENENEHAKEFVRRYLNNLLLALTNIANVLQPQVIAIGGGVSYSIKHHIPQLEKRLNRAKYSGYDAPYIKLVQAELGNEAGGYGACALTIY